MAQNQLSQFAQLAAAPKTFGALEVRERVITTEGLAISIDNVATVSTVEYTNSSWVLVMLLALGSLGSSGGNASNPLLLIAAALGVTALVMFFFRKKLRLIIGTSDGSRIHFKGPNPKLLHEVREFITRKIDQKDTRLTLVANFEKGIIENLHVDQLSAGAVVQGNNNQVAAHSPGARVGSHDTHTTTTHHATNSPGAQVGAGNVSRGSTTTATIQVIDYASVLPEIERWRQSAAGSPGWEHVAERLATLESLLAAGTPTRDQKSSARSIATDLSQMLQGYPAAVQLFQAVIRMIGL